MLQKSCSLASAILFSCVFVLADVSAIPTFLNFHEATEDEPSFKPESNEFEIISTPDERFQPINTMMFPSELDVQSGTGTFETDTSSLINEPVSGQGLQKLNDIPTTLSEEKTAKAVEIGSTDYNNALTTKTPDKGLFSNPAQDDVSFIQMYLNLAVAVIESFMESVQFFLNTPSVPRSKLSGTQQLIYDQSPSKRVTKRDLQTAETENDKKTVTGKTKVDNDNKPQVTTENILTNSNSDNLCCPLFGTHNCDHDQSSSKKVIKRDLQTAGTVPNEKTDTIKPEVSSQDRPQAVSDTFPIYPVVEPDLEASKPDVSKQPVLATDLLLTTKNKVQASIAEGSLEDKSSEPNLLSTVKSFGVGTELNAPKEQQTSFIKTMIEELGAQLGAKVLEEPNKTNNDEVKNLDLPNNQFTSIEAGKRLLEEQKKNKVLDGLFFDILPKESSSTPNMFVKDVIEELKKNAALPGFNPKDLNNLNFLQEQSEDGYTPDKSISNGLLLLIIAIVATAVLLLGAAAAYKLRLINVGGVPTGNRNPSCPHSSLA